jgi:Kef-type K+ transport system membrane component KefB
VELLPGGLDVVVVGPGDVVPQLFHPSAIVASAADRMIDYTDLAIAVAAATAAPLLVDLLPIPKVPTIVSEIVAGIAIGPVVLDIVTVTAPLEVFSQVGLVFLFFLAGLEIAFDAEDDRHLGLVGGAFVISLALALVVAVTFEAVELVGAPLLVAIILAATSFGIVVAVLKDAGQTRTPFGQLVIAGASIADFATVILLSLFFSSSGASFESTLVLLILFLAVVAAVGALMAGARGSVALKATVARLHRTSAQIGVRIAWLLLTVIVFLSVEFGLEVVLGGFLAGALVSLLDREDALATSGLQDKLDAIGFGIFIPIFFVVSGVQLDLDSLFSSFDTIVLVPLTVIALLVVRGVPALVYGRFIPQRQVLSAGLLQATSLSFVVAATQIGVELGKLEPAAAAGLVTGGVVSVLLFPALALRVLRPAP